MEWSWRQFHFGSRVPLTPGLRITLQRMSSLPGKEYCELPASPVFADNAWIGNPSDVPHGGSPSRSHDISYMYLHKKTLGDSVYGPIQEGSIRFRMPHTDSSDGVEVASVSFKVSK